MKKRLLLAAGLAACLFCHGEGHMKFSGVELDGPAQRVAEALTAKGFERAECKGDNAACVSGIFIGDRAWGTIAENQSGETSSISLDFPHEESQSRLLHVYKRYKNLYIQKYGMPASVNEEMDQNNYAFLQLIDETVTHKCRFETGNGYIEISLVGDKEIHFGIPKIDRNVGGHIRITYTDRENTKSDEQKFLDQI